jgi:hypothetical protein
LRICVVAAAGLDLANAAALTYKISQYWQTESLCAAVNLFGSAVAGDAYSPAWCTYVSTPLVDWTRIFVDSWVEHVSPALMSKYSRGMEIWTGPLGWTTSSFHVFLLVWVIFWNLHRLWSWLRNLVSTFFGGVGTRTQEKKALQPTTPWAMAMAYFLSGAVVTAIAMHFTDQHLFLEISRAIYSRCISISHRAVAIIAHWH